MEISERNEIVETFVERCEMYSFDKPWTFLSAHPDVRRTPDDPNLVLAALQEKFPSAALIDAALVDIDDNGAISLHPGLDVAGSPFVALNGHLRQEVDFGGNFVAQAGWQWRGSDCEHLLRAGVHYYNGKSPQFQFFDRFEHQIGFGIWYDF